MNLLISRWTHVAVPRDHLFESLPHVLLFIPLPGKNFTHPCGSLSKALVTLVCLNNKCRSTNHYPLIRPYCLALFIVRSLSTQSAYQPQHDRPVLRYQAYLGTALCIGQQYQIFLSAIPRVQCCRLWSASKSDKSSNFNPSIYHFISKPSEI